LAEIARLISLTDLRPRSLNSTVRAMRATIPKTIEVRLVGEKMKEIRSKLEMRMQEHMVEKLHVEMNKLLKHIFGDKGQNALIAELNEKLIKKGKLKPRMMEIAKEVLRIKQKAKSKKLTQTELHRISRDAEELINSLLEYAQRKELVSAQKGVIQVLHGDKKGELVITDLGIFYVEESKIKKIENKKFAESNKKELEEAVTKTRDRLQIKVTSEILNTLKKELGDFELVI